MGADVSRPSLYRSKNTVANNDPAAKGVAYCNNLVDNFFLPKKITHPTSEKIAPTALDIKTTKALDSIATTIFTTNNNCKNVAIIVTIAT